MIEVLEAYRGKLTRNRVIEPGVYEDDDPRVADVVGVMLRKGKAVRVGEEEKQFQLKKRDDALNFLVDPNAERIALNIENAAIEDVDDFPMLDEPLPDVDWDKQYVAADLRGMLFESGIEFKKRANKAELVELVQAAYENGELLHG